MNKKFAVFTVCNLNYLPKALVLAESLLNYGQDKIKIYLIDRKCDVILPSTLADFVWIEDVYVPHLYELAFKYDITEFSTCVKPFITIKLLETFDKVIFLDPDTCVYRSINGIFDTLNDYPIVLTPHYIIPQDNYENGSDIGMMRYGSFNLGFYAVNKSHEALSFLRWWWDRCFSLCYFETQFGLSTDQKWVSIAPCFFPNLLVSFNLGYNMAYWNLKERFLTGSEDAGYVVNNEYPLVFFHFSSFDGENSELLSTRFFPERDEGRKDLIELALNYKHKLQLHTIEASKVKYGFDYMSNGDYISPSLRRAYACISSELQAGHNPFDSDGPVGRFAKRNFLIEKNQSVFAYARHDDKVNHKLKFACINFSMRLILRMIGPNRFANFSRLLVYLSGYRNNRDLWKL